MQVRHTLALHGPPPYPGDGGGPKLQPPTQAAGSVACLFSKWE